MRKIFIIPILLFILSSCSSLDKSNEIKLLTAKVDSLSYKVDKLSEQNTVMEEEFTWIENEMVDLKKQKSLKTELPTATPTTKVTEKTTSAKATPEKAAPEKVVADWQCIAITNAGTRCSRPAVKDSKYCWQHKKTYEPDQIENKNTPPAGSASGDPKK